MNTFTIAAIFVIAFTFSSAYEIVEDFDGQQYYLVPADAVVHRERRQTSVDISKSGAGTRVTAGHQGTLFNNGVHKLDGSASVSKQFRPSGPTSLGGGLNYNHIPSGSNLNVGASHTRGFGTDVGVTGTANILRSNNGNTRLDAVGNYNRHFGGPGGTGRPDYYGGLQFSHRF